MNTRARRWLFAVAFPVAGLSLSLAGSLAEEVPRNPNTITSLTVEAADVLAQRKVGRLRLGGLTTLSATAAQSLRHHHGEGLSLAGLTRQPGVRHAAREPAAEQGRSRQMSEPLSQRGRYTDIFCRWSRG